MDHPQFDVIMAKKFLNAQPFWFLDNLKTQNPTSILRNGILFQSIITSC
jgi:hypothetical protein